MTTKFKLENKESMLKISLDGKVLYEIKKGGKKPFVINRQRGEEKGVLELHRGENYEFSANFNPNEVVLKKGDTNFIECRFGKVSFEVPFEPTWVLIDIREEERLLKEAEEREKREAEERKKAEAEAIKKKLEEEKQQKESQQPA